MGNLTDDMTRLRGEVEAMRGARSVLMQDLARGASDLTKVVAAMRADFASAHTEMARKSRGERKAFVADVILEVNSLLVAFCRERDTMARKGRDDRGTFLADLRREVTNMCQETSEDLMGARRVWCGQSFRYCMPVQLKMESEIVTPEPPPMAEARVEQEQDETPMPTMNEASIEVTAVTALPETPVEVAEVTALPEIPVEVVAVTAEPEIPVDEMEAMETPVEIAEVTVAPETPVETVPEPVSLLGVTPSKKVTRRKRGNK